MNAETILRAVGALSDAYILEARAALQRPRVRPQRRAWRVVLIAAALAALFTATAYAMGWFDLRGRVIETEIASDGSLHDGLPMSDASPEPTAALRRWLSLNGGSESPEFEASAAWLRFEHEYLSGRRVSDDDAWQAGLDEETVNICRYYGVYDLAMLEELQSIAEEYGLRLHTRRITPVSLGDFYRAAGTGAFLAEGTGSGYLYEDGSFLLEGRLSGEKREDKAFTIIKNLSGAIPAMEHGIGDPEGYREREYTNVHGDTVLIVRREDPAELRLFYERDAVFVEVYAPSTSSLLADDEGGERLADAILFRELVKTEVDFAAAVHEPTAYDGAESAASLADFRACAEGQAMEELCRLSYSLWGTEAGRAQLETERAALAARYGLQGAGGHVIVTKQEHIDSGVFDGDGPQISTEDFAALGYDPRLVQQFVFLELWENGALGFSNEMRWQYIPKGALCPFVEEPFAENYPQQWFYRTACGEVVQISTDELSNLRASVVVCETEKGWVFGMGGHDKSVQELEALADAVDFSCFP